MIAGSSTKNAPSPKVVLPHYAVGALSFLTASILLFFTSGDIVNSYVSPKVLSITHILVLGWITMIIFGALYQLIPVVMEVKLFSETLAYISFITLISGTILIAINFWTNYINNTLMLEIGGTSIFISVFLFVVNALGSARKSDQKTIENRFIIISAFWLLLTVLLGIFMVLNASLHIVAKSSLELLKIHVHIGVIGWFMMLVIGVASKLLPMFFIVHKLKPKYLHISFWLTNTGLLLVGIVYYFKANSLVSGLLSLPIIVGVMFFVKYNYDAYKARLRKKLDIGLKLSVFSFVLLFASIIFGLVSFTNPDFLSEYSVRFNTAYMVLLILGFFTSLILGQMYKTLPFIVWLQRYSDKVGKFKIPMPAGMYSGKVADFHYYSYIPAIILLVVGIFAKLEILVQISSVFFVITAILYTYNTFKVILHKDESKPLK